MKKWLERFKKDERGLTLVELLAVIVILAIVGAIAFVAIGNVMENSRKDAHIANAQQLISAAKLYDASAHQLSGTDNSVALGELTDVEASKTLRGFGLIGEFTDPWGGTGYTGTVTKDADGYKVNIAGGNVPDEIKFGTLNIPESVINQGREAVESHIENSSGQ